MFDEISIPEEFLIKKQPRYKVAIIPTWNEAKRIFEKFTNQWMFRGQENSTWSLVPSLCRFGKNTGEISLEEISLMVFKNRAKEYPEVLSYNPKTTFEWLYIMRHYGVPTRLLDWTFCPYIAGFFAFHYLDPFSPDASCAIWAINKEWCKNQALSRIRMIDKYKNIAEDADFTSEECFKDLFLDNFMKYKLNFVYPLKPELSRMFYRMKDQNGIFLCQGNDDVTFEDNLCFEREENGFPEDIEKARKLIEEREKFIIKFIIEGKHRKDVLGELEEKRKTLHTLFKSLDLYAESVVRYLKQLDKHSGVLRETAIREIKEKLGDS